MRIVHEHNTGNLLSRVDNLPYRTTLSHRVIIVRRQVMTRVCNRIT